MGKTKAQKAMDRYSQKEDVVMRLDDSLVRYKGKVWYCRANGMNVDLYDWPTPGGSDYVHKISSNNPELDISSFEIGYVNRGERAWFITRAPFRKQKQGLSVSNVLWTTYGHTINKMDAGDFFHQRTRDALDGKYPSVFDCVNMLLTSKSLISRAFHNNFAVYKEDNVIKLLMDETIIGVLLDNSNVRFTLYPGHNNSVVVFKLISLGVPLD